MLHGVHDNVPDLPPPSELAREWRALHKVGTRPHN